MSSPPSDWSCCGRRPAGEGNSDREGPVCQELVVDFVADLVSMMCQDMERLGYDVEDLGSNDRIARCFFNVQRRRVSQEPRSVAKADAFHCPIEVAEGLRNLEAKIEKGDDINPHQSRTLKSSDYEDALFNDWGFHHFHLGLVAEPDGFIERTGPVLIARVLPSAVHMLDVRDHGKGAKPPWSAQKLLEDYHRNWPHHMESVRLRGVTEPTPFSDEQVAQMRKAGLTIVSGMPDGSVYMPLGGGYTSARTSMRSRILTDRWFWQVTCCQEWVEANQAVLEDSARQDGVALGAVREFHLIELVNEHCVVVETHSSHGFRIPIETDGSPQGAAEPRT